MFQTNYRTRVLATQEFTRPGDTTAYAAGDVIGPVTTPAVITFPNAALENGGVGRIVNTLVANNAVTVANSGLALHIYNTSITPIADNAQFTLLWANRASYQGTILLDTVPTLSASGFGTGTDSKVWLSSQQLTTAAQYDGWFQCASTSTSLYGILTARAAYATAASEVFSIRLTIEYGN
jgi:hypothetical protein